jgi:hypothetical protein
MRQERVGIVSTASSNLFEVSARFLLVTLLHYPSSGVRNQLGYVFDFKLVFNARAVSVHCLCAEMKFAGDLLRRKSLSDQLEHFELPVSEVLDDCILRARLLAGNPLQERNPKVESPRG